MGNFMVLNLFLALLLNSFNSEELKSKKEASQGPQRSDQLLLTFVNVYMSIYDCLCVCQQCYLNHRTTKLKNARNRHGLRGQPPARALNDPLN